ncbi:hemerythrin domain-containing protein [Streptomyces fagopyri]|uniref:Hemerythrin domain-containing protein n=1 Tax=Streptomyces fagopyri TaxID=2662397 RepID=A0A5Q0L575_9ACTN|nr:hemerythrin domain-containing protein [Streptomyces fagopyri]QFZ72038.1 hemerythrin domain-containing protein [Streptomyces fagopyri]
MNPPTSESAAVVETRLAHDVHRLATALLVTSAERATVPLSALGQLRDFLVVNLRHHHETEDHDLWPRILKTAPDLVQGLHGLTDEHEQLDAALARLAAVVISEGGEETGVRSALRSAAIAVRDTVLAHLDHEEPVLFPALRDHLSAAQWREFAREVIATTPPVAGHLMIGFLDEVGTPDEVALVLAGLPEPVLPLLPAMRHQAEDDLRTLRGSGS